MLLKEEVEGLYICGGVERLKSKDKLSVHMNICQSYSIIDVNVMGEYICKL